MSRLIIKFRASGIPSSDTRKRITRELNDVIAGAPGVTIYDYNDAIDPIRTGNRAHRLIVSFCCVCGSVFVYLCVGVCVSTLMSVFLCVSRQAHVRLQRSSV